MKQQLFNPTEQITLELIIRKREETAKQAKIVQNAIAERFGFLFMNNEETDEPTGFRMNGTMKLITWINGIMQMVRIMRAIHSFFTSKK